MCICVQDCARSLTRDLLGGASSHAAFAVRHANLVGVTSYDEEAVWDRGVFGESAVLLSNHRWDKSQLGVNFAMSSLQHLDKFHLVPSASASLLGHGERRDWSS